MLRSMATVFKCDHILMTLLQFRALGYVISKNTLCKNMFSKKLACKNTYCERETKNNEVLVNDV